MLKLLNRLLIVGIIGLTGCSLISADAAAQTNIVNTKELIDACHANGWTMQKYMALKEGELGEEGEESDRHSQADVNAAISLKLLNCLASSDSSLRDGIAYELNAKWLRSNQINSQTQKAMFDVLVTALQSDVVDEYGVYQPFAALMLSEVVRADRIAPYLNKAERAIAVNIITQYFINIIDYRGFDESIGWRHAVAHSADLMLQLALNPAINKAQLTQMLAALSTQVVPQTNHFYHYGESKRIAMPVIYIMLRGFHEPQEWQNWLENVTEPLPFEDWNSIYHSQQGLVKVHNTRAFLHALYSLIKPSDNETLIIMVPALEQAIKKVN